jgi:Methyltransferase domain
VGRRARALNVWLGEHGCTQVTVDESHVPALPFESESFDAALLIGVLDRLAEPYRAARQLHRILRPGGVLLVTAVNDCYWRRRLDRVLPGEDRRSSSYTPGPCAACCWTPASTWSACKARTARSSATCPWPAAGAAAAAPGPTGPPSGSSPPCSAPGSARSRSGSEGPVLDGAARGARAGGPNRGTAVAEVIARRRQPERNAGKSWPKVG